MIRKSFIYCLIILFSITVLSGCSRMPGKATFSKYRPSLAKVKPALQRLTPGFLKRKKYPAALPMRKVAGGKTCQTNTAARSASKTAAKTVQKTTVAKVAAKRQTSNARPVQTKQAHQSQPRTRLNTGVANTNLFNAAKSGNTRLMANMLASGANVNAANNNGETALHAAASSGQTAAAQLLIQRGANVNAVTVNGWTPLHTASRFGSTGVAQLLLTNGAQVNARNRDGKTPLQLANQTRQFASAQLLRSRGGI